MKDANQYIPDDLLSNILSRLPVKSAFRCRVVCKRWRDLTFDRYFVDLQFKRNCNIPTIFVANLELPSSRFDLFAYDKWWEPAESIYNNHRFPLYAWKFPCKSLALFSHAGLVAFQEKQYTVESKTNFIILNPTSRENVRITFSNEHHGRQTSIYGVYFHPSLNQYCCLFMTKLIHARLHHPDRIQYKMLTLGSNPSLKKLSNPFSNRLIKRDIESHPLLINNYLYWMLESSDKETEYKYTGRNDIMKFDIISEEFTIIPCPVPLDTKCKFFQTHLVNIDDVLSFLLIRPFKITIWRMEDQAHKFYQTTTEYTFDLQIRPISPSVAVVVDGKLALWSDGRKLRVYNLKEGSVMKKNYQKRKYGDCVMFLSHQMSLASLRNCKATIFIDEDGKLVIPPTDEDGLHKHIHRRRQVHKHIHRHRRGHKRI